MEIVNVYNKVRSILSIYASIPETIINWVKDNVNSITKNNKEN
jgi:hypothetical protein